MKDSEEKQLTQLFEGLSQAEAPVQTSWEVLSVKLVKSFWKFSWSHWNVFYLTFSAIIAAGIVLFLFYDTSSSSPQVIKEQRVDSPSTQFTNTADVQLRKDQNQIPVNSDNSTIIPDSHEPAIANSSSNNTNDFNNNNNIYTNVDKADSVSMITDTTATHIKPPEQKVVKEPSGKKIIIFADDTVVTVVDTIRTNKKPKKNKR
ncbi:hypothetical protein [Sporocytophaga myxococcoides]|uniref:hypothetical protein n=1 Tax=Sporocytophaga myxococcoides TaxID=153721 RepID=UPI0004014AC2|nr:hypothetical protein [Sporocytophaga myxococcoides]